MKLPEVLRNYPSSSPYNNYGIYRGIVDDVADPQKLGRVRVRVDGITPQDVPTGNLPWAEMGSMHGGKLFGIITHYEVGDGVWVMFERGYRMQPVVLGGWISQSLGINDLPADIQANNGAGMGKYMLIDRAGNVFELSELSNEQWARMVSGSAEVRVSNIDGSVSLIAKAGIVRTQAQGEYHTVQMYTCNGGQVLIEATALDSLGGVSGIMDLFANLELNLHVDGDAETDGVIHIGGYTPTLAGVKPVDPVTALVAGQQPRQTKVVQVISRIVEIGSGVSDTDPTIPPTPPVTPFPPGVPRPETEQVIVNGVTVRVTAKAAVNAPSLLAPLILIEVIGGSATIQSDTEIEAVCGDSMVTLTPTQVNAAASGQIQAAVGDSSVTLLPAELTAKVASGADVSEVDMTPASLNASVTDGANTAQLDLTASTVTAEAGGTTLLVNSAGVTIT